MSDVLSRERGGKSMALLNGESNEQGQPRSASPPPVVQVRDDFSDHIYDAWLTPEDYEKLEKKYEDAQAVKAVLSHMSTLTIEDLTREYNQRQAAQQQQQRHPQQQQSHQQPHQQQEQQQPQQKPHQGKAVQRRSTSGYDHLPPHHVRDEPTHNYDRLDEAVPEHPPTPATAHAALTKPAGSTTNVAATPPASMNWSPTADTSLDRMASENSEQHLYYAVHEQKPAPGTTTDATADDGSQHLYAAINEQQVSSHSIGSVSIINNNGINKANNSHASSSNSNARRTAAPKPAVPSRAAATRCDWTITCPPLPPKKHEDAPPRPPVPSPSPAAQGKPAADHTGSQAAVTAVTDVTTPGVPALPPRDAAEPVSTQPPPAGVVDPPNAVNPSPSSTHPHQRKPREPMPLPSSASSSSLSSQPRHLPSSPTPHASHPNHGQPAHLDRLVHPDLPQREAAGLRPLPVVPTTPFASVAVASPPSSPLSASSSAAVLQPPAYGPSGVSKRDTRGPLTAAEEDAWLKRGAVTCGPLVLHVSDASFARFVHHCTTRRMASALLKGYFHQHNASLDTDGTYLLRSSLKKRYTIVVSVLYQGSTRHYEFSLNKDLAFVNEHGRVFGSLRQMLTFFQKNKDKLCCRLRHCLAPPPARQ
ncbi:hypothetical protein PTSG_08237 [Salpingoeca rosetta]|uniref:SH2 domain-containing protein n=1 Tax=Salpingoeca rosetta (strain ATCC 50818 / BSB-021) TaxID=946362 RepID=F2UIE2_SALR5|nr:uncharacterized protein PTSG_08237 [Salpingoeca rosetta]EGD76891.1 hypothetical protein PTSG_08237 [Salpingoeca rosetta]|eukprot:XP_004991263.1 hypothetical protein PTSG_08237 [Salpingoeca rosetta]